VKEIKCTAESIEVPIDDTRCMLVVRIEAQLTEQEARLIQTGLQDKLSQWWPTNEKFLVLVVDGNVPIQVQLERISRE